MKRTAAILLISLSVLGGLITTGCGPPKPQAGQGGPRESLTLGTLPGDLSSLIWIAKERGLFDEQGLDVDIKLYESGSLTVKDVLDGKLDLGTATEFVVTRQIELHPDLRIISILAESNDIKLVARRDHGISEVAELRHKRVGLARGSNAEFFLQLMLTLKRVQLDDVEIVDLLPTGQVEAIAKGEIDAVLVWEPYAKQVQDRLGANAVSWEGQSGQAYYWLLLSREEVVKQRPAAMQRLLASLASAESFIKKSEEEAMHLLARQLESGHIVSTWEQHRFRLGLHRPLIVALETETRWMATRAGSGQSDSPDFLDVISFNALKSVSPEKVGLLH